jgi:hypothetical protein
LLAWPAPRDAGIRICDRRFRTPESVFWADLFKLVVLLVVRGRVQAADRADSYSNLEPTVGFEPTTRCLQIRRQLNSVPDFRFPCIRRTSIASKEFHSGGYNGGTENRDQICPAAWPEIAEMARARRPLFREQLKGNRSARLPRQRVPKAKDAIRSGHSREATQSPVMASILPAFTALLNTA